jgi:hypothetical protein
MCPRAFGLVRPSSRYSSSPRSSRSCHLQQINPRRAARQLPHGAPVRLTTPISGAESERDADRRLQSFIRELEPKLGQYLPPEAISDQKSALSSIGTSIIGDNMSVLVHASRHRAQRALALCAFLLLAGCGSAEDHYQRSLKLLDQKDYVKAGLEFRNAVKLKKDFVPAWRELSQIEERN